MGAKISKLTKQPKKGKGTLEHAARPHIEHTSAPENLLRIVPQQKRNSLGLPVEPRQYELTADVIELALSTVADFFYQNNEHITIVTVGGAINTLMLNSRKTTRDVDFFGTDITDYQYDLLENALDRAIEENPVPLGGKWLSSQGRVSIGTALETQLTKAAIEQGEMVFKQPGLTVFAAPWHFGIAGKLDRISKPERRGYDVADAVAYLRMWSMVNENRAVTRAELKNWAKMFGKICSDEAIDNIKDAYYNEYGLHAVVD